MGCARVQLDVNDVVKCYKLSERRLLVLGYNATLTTAVEAPRQPKRHYDQIKVSPRTEGNACLIWGTVRNGVEPRPHWSCPWIWREVLRSLAGATQLVALTDMNWLCAR
jgi:hypothetical protein